MGVSMKFTDLDQYLFGQGTNYEVYKKLGAHPTTYRRKKGVYFAVWAPNAQSVSVIGEFNDWEEEANPMEKVGPIGVYEVFVPGQRSDSCINSLSWVRMERSYIKQILMQMKLNSVRVQPPGSQISQTINGRMPHGSRTERSLMSR